MSSETKELVEICERLAEKERVQLAEFARFLLEKHGDEAWERIIADDRPRPKLDQFVRESLAEGSEPLDLDKF